MTKTEKPKNEHLDLACKMVCDSGMNIYCLIGHYRKRSKYTGQIPDDVIINVCNQYLNPHKPILNQWAWFVAALHRATQDYFHAQNKKQIEIPSSMRELFKMMGS